MITYTLDEIRALARIYEDLAIKPDLDSDVPQPYNYIDVIETVIKEKITPEASLMEFLGAYDTVVYDNQSCGMLHHFLFEEPLEVMVTHINDTSINSWKAKVAKWRLQIGK